MRYAQVKFTNNAEFIKLKKAALDKGISLETFIKEAINKELKTIADEQLTADSISLTAKLKEQ